MFSTLPERNNPDLEDGSQQIELFNDNWFTITDHEALWQDITTQQLMEAASHVPPPAEFADNLE